MGVKQIGLKEIMCEVLDYIQLVLNRAQSRAVVNTVMNLRVP
jgi:hypothetical protein